MLSSIVEPLHSGWGVFIEERVDRSRSGGGDGEVFTKTLTMSEDDEQALPFTVKLNEPGVFSGFYLS